MALSVCEENIKIYHNLWCANEYRHVPFYFSDLQRYQVLMYCMCTDKPGHLNTWSKIVELEGSLNLPMSIIVRDILYCITLNFRATKISQICHLGHFWAFNTTLLLHRGGSQLSASFYIKNRTIIKEVMVIKAGNVCPYPSWVPPREYTRKLSAREI